MPTCEKVFDGYQEEQFVSADLICPTSSRRVYIVNGGVRDDYFYRLNNVTNVGDWVGPAGYFRLFRALDVGEAAKFLRSLGVSAILINPDKDIGGLDKPLEDQLASARFNKIHIPGSRYVLFIDSLSRCRMV